MPIVAGLDPTPLNHMVLKVAFASGPDDPAPTWTDITSYWTMSAPSQITRGRQDENSTVQPGTLQVTLDNTDGRFTAGNVASPYYPNVKLRKQIRLSYVDPNTSIEYPLFTGLV